METDAVRERYERRKLSVENNRYSLLNAAVLQMLQERQRVMLKMFCQMGFKGFEKTRLLEIGCGKGDNLLDFMRIGFQPENLCGIELLEDRVEYARKILPDEIVLSGDASVAQISENSQDIVFQSVVFSSLLDDAFQEKLANKMWSWVKPGGSILWYDFIFDNPNNPDVRAVPIKRVRALFPNGVFKIKRLTLAPPIARRICKIHPSLYTVLNLFPFLRTHILCWIQKTP